MCVCVCVCVREREREGERDTVLHRFQPSKAMDAATVGGRIKNLEIHQSVPRPFESHTASPCGLPHPCASVFGYELQSQ